MTSPAPSNLIGCLKNSDSDDPSAFLKKKSSDIFTSKLLLLHTLSLRKKATWAPNYTLLTFAGDECRFEGAVSRSFLFESTVIHSDPLLSHPPPALFPPEPFLTPTVRWLVRRFP